jgi:hypothetical protein
MPRYEIIFEDETNFTIYKLKVRRSHHKGGYKSIEQERISPKDIDRHTLLKLKRKGLANLPRAVLP